MSTQNSAISNTLNSLRSLDADVVFTAVFAGAAFYFFEGITSLTFGWFSYTLTPEIALYAALAAFAGATLVGYQDLQYMPQWQQIAWGMGPTIMLLTQHVPAVADPVMGSVMYQAGAFVLALVSFAIAAR